MTDQAMLFGSTGDRAENDPDRLTVCALNVQSAPPARAHKLAEWLLSTEASVLVLTEIRDSDGSRQLLETLRADGFSTTPAQLNAAGAPTAGDKYHAVIATFGHQISRQLRGPMGNRVAVTDLTTVHGQVRIVGMYAPANGMTLESSHTRAQFQRRALGELAALRRPRTVFAGDLNVVEPGHEPRLTAYETHDYEFYTAICSAGMVDTFRSLHPDQHEHSWFSDRFLAQRIDHTFMTSATGTVTGCHYDRTTIDTSLSDHSAMITTIDLRTGQATGSLTSP
ncbi:endonuclease/exonuclease/phosphatase family protein [Nocardia sp. NBC_01327]|uniref:endonuclease/exonuclease/phosphatase family protein n=1 Tax=Nocardia sp. NBC_01327 TaxID=2903593 RepID=UPI002E0EC092|nr:endonuclease/exonuclease/phosphatase family protein [Nocardia sp. NBC_01327]